MLSCRKLFSIAINLLVLLTQSVALEGDLFADFGTILAFPNRSAHSSSCGGDMRNLTFSKIARLNRGSSPHFGACTTVAAARLLPASACRSRAMSSAAPSAAAAAEAPASLHTLESLQFNNTFLNELPGDKSEVPGVRQVRPGNRATVAVLHPPLQRDKALCCRLANSALSWAGLRSPLVLRDAHAHQGRRATHAGCQVRAAAEGGPALPSLLLLNASKQGGTARGAWGSPCKAST